MKCLTSLLVILSMALPMATTCVLLVGCSDDGRPAECPPAIAFPGPDSSMLRFEYLYKLSRDAYGSIPLLPEDAGHQLRVFPTTASDEWEPGGSLLFVDATGETIYRYDDLCVSDFSTMEWRIPGAAAEARIIVTTAAIATLLFTAVVEP